MGGDSASLSWGPQHITVWNSVILAETSNASLHSLFCSCFISICCHLGSSAFCLGQTVLCVSCEYDCSAHSDMGGSQQSETGGSSYLPCILLYLLSLFCRLFMDGGASPFTTEAEPSFWVCDCRRAVGSTRWPTCHSLVTVHPAQCLAS